MQFSKILVSAFAVFAAAAPATTQVEEREVETRSLLGANQLIGINNGVFNLNAFSYLTSINGLGFNSLDPLFSTLIGQGFDISVFNPIFQSNVLSVDVIAQVANLQFLNTLVLQGVFAGRNLNNLVLPNLGFGNLNQLVGLDLAGFVDPSLFGNINAIAAQNIFITKE